MDAILIKPENYDKIFARHSPGEMREMDINKSSLDTALEAASGADVYFCSNFYSRDQRRAGVWIPLIQSFVKRRFDVMDEKKIRDDFVEIRWKE